MNDNKKIPMQNIPIRTPEGKRIRDAFTTSTDGPAFTMNYQRIESELMHIVLERLRREDPAEFDEFMEGIPYALVHDSIVVEVEELTDEQKKKLGEVFMRPSKWKTVDYLSTPFTAEPTTKLTWEELGATMKSIKDLVRKKGIPPGEFFIAADMDQIEMKKYRPRGRKAMSDAKYDKCSRHIHIPVEVDVEYPGGDTIYITAVCDVCGMRLESDVSPGDWDALIDDNTPTCPTCEEALPFCNCKE